MTALLYGTQNPNPWMQHNSGKCSLKYPILGYVTLGCAMIILLMVCIFLEF